MKRDGEQESKVDIVRARKVGRMGDRQGGSEEGDKRRWMGWTQRLMERGTDGGRQGLRAGMVVGNQTERTERD